MPENIETMHCEKLADEIKNWIQIFPYKSIDEKTDKVLIHLIDSEGSKSITYSVPHDFYKKYFSEINLIKNEK